MRSQRKLGVSTTLDARRIAAAPRVDEICKGEGAHLQHPPAADRMEIRPAAELGPIILCLDTSGSMRGARETVAKALTLECMRGAHRQRRKCFVYAFR